jgi:Ca2+-binding EF-hand superfamily protein
MCKLYKLKSPVSFPEVNAAFAAFDKDKNGRITTGELEAALQVVGDNPSKKDVRCMIKDFDLDGESHRF